jgi:NTE family protein
MVWVGEPEQRAAVRPVRLGLQGGGAHGAFTWGVLDRLLEEPWLRIEAVSGTSAGAMNAVVLADGLAEGGPEGARAALRALWTAIGRAAAYSPIRRGLLDRLAGRSGLDRSPSYLFFDGLSRYVSPYDVNPLGFNPLRDVVARQVNFDRVNSSAAIEVHVAATNVRTGLPEIFSRGGLSVEAVLASACLPQLFAAVEIDGESYWDGGFTANPPLFPLVGASGEADILIVQVNPVERAAVPRRAREIINRVNEISFNASLDKELAALAAMRGTGRSRLRLHRIHGGADTAALTASSKLHAEPGQLERLFEQGRRRAQNWLTAHGARIGTDSTLDLDLLFARRRPAQVRVPPPRPRSRRRRLLARLWPAS